MTMQVAPGHPQRKEGAIQAQEPVLRTAAAAIEKKAEDPVILDVRGIVSYCDYFLLFSGTNRRHVRAIADHVLEALKKDQELVPMGVEGLESCRWVLLDFGAFVVHVFDEELRSFYDLEGLWADAPRLAIPGVAQPDGARPRSGRSRGSAAGEGGGEWDPLTIPRRPTPDLDVGT